MNGPQEPGRGDADALREIEKRVRARMATVERQNDQLRRRTRLLGLGLLVVGAVLAVVAVAPDTLSVVGLGNGQERVEARAFHLVDANGVTRGEWSVDADGRARLSLLDRRGRQRLNVSVRESGSPGLALVNADGERRAVLGVLDDETATLVFADETGVPRAVLGMTPQDGSHLLLADANGATRLGLVLDPSGLGSVMLPDSAEAADTDSGEGGS